MKKTPNTETIALSAQLIELSGTAPTEFRLLPAGRFRAKDGRPLGLSGWVMTEASASALLSASAQQADEYLIDYDHQTLHSKTNGQKAPAAGWFSALSWRPNDGLYATDVGWNESAQAAIEAKEYRYISPVLKYNPSTGEITGLLMAALVNYPALDGLTDLAAAHFDLSLQGSIMDQDELLERLRYMLNLPTLATLDEILAELDKLKAAISTPEGTTTGLSAFLAAQTDQLTALSALSAQTPDPALFVSVEVMAALQADFAALSIVVNTDKISKLIEPALADGRLLAAQKGWAQKLGESNLESLSAYLDSAQPIAALSGMQTKGKAPEGTVTAALSVDEQAVASQLGLTDEQMIKYRSE
ncbi:phage protease [Methylobacter sp. S3L5C]|uniref:phage protease n=1 Tax=Methylobacter sp. S3L5C TaxID=2839024 RepID=UPI001FADB1FB|nr:phage protease [Methylobacter sp. S3L5C]UOA07784.1 phage protease [Methylobacter sp. S3L5C]